MSYNNIGLASVRGSGTNGYVQKNLSTVRRHKDHTKCVTLLVLLAVLTTIMPWLPWLSPSLASLACLSKFSTCPCFHVKGVVIGRCHWLGGCVSSACSPFTAMHMQRIALDLLPSDRPMSKATHYLSSNGWPLAISLVAFPWPASQ
jgi:hypothetical protein